MTGAARMDAIAAVIGFMPNPPANGEVRPVAFVMPKP
jgi:hypothetical protein